MNGHGVLPELVVRPIRDDDRERLRRLWDRLSPETVYRRFFTLYPALPSAVLEHLLAADHRDHDGLVALDGDEIVAVARWDRTPSDGGRAELSVMVEDAWQHRGLGRALMAALTAEAARHGVTDFAATILTENRPARRLATALGRPTSIELDGPVTYFAYLAEGRSSHAPHPSRQDRPQDRPAPGRSRPGQAA